MANEVDGCGLSTSCCTYHWASLIEEINGGNNLDKEFLSDYAKIYIMMESKTDVVRCLSKLASQLADLKESSDFSDEYKSKEGAGNHYIKLSKALEKFEAYCWFPPSHEIFIGFLPSDSFQSYIRKGLMCKDPGAGLEHGDFTHRLHWHCISRIITNDFSTAKGAKWNNSPLQLFCSLGSAPATSADNNVWFKLLDDNGSASFRSPDKFHKHVRQGGYGMLSSNVARRYTKRANELNAHIDQKTLAAYKKSFRDIAAPLPNSPNRTITPAADYRNRMTQKANDAYAARKSQVYDKVENLPVVVRSNVKDAIPIETRLRKSVGGLNQIAQGDQDFSVYSKTLGIVTRGSAFSNLSNLKTNPNNNANK
jgi:hypothetical protein